nr:hypothetical protein L204_04955 [Cryptococcus depauperatus CBS 7855]
MQLKSQAGQDLSTGLIPSQRGTGSWRYQSNRGCAAYNTVFKEDLLIDSWQGVDCDLVRDTMPFDVDDCSVTKRSLCSPQVLHDACELCEVFPVSFAGVKDDVQEMMDGL